MGYWESCAMFFWTVSPLAINFHDSPNSDRNTDQIEDVTNSKMDFIIYILWTNSPTEIITWEWQICLFTGTMGSCMGVENIEQCLCNTLFLQIVLSYSKGVHIHQLLQLLCFTSGSTEQPTHLIRSRTDQKDYLCII